MLEWKNDCAQDSHGTAVAATAAAVTREAHAQKNIADTVHIPIHPQTQAHAGTAQRSIGGSWQHHSCQRG